MGLGVGEKFVVVLLLLFFFLFFSRLTARGTIWDSGPVCHPSKGSSNWCTSHAIMTTAYQS